MAGEGKVSQRKHHACRAVCLALCVCLLWVFPVKSFAGNAPDSTEWFSQDFLSQLLAVATQTDRRPGQIVLPSRPVSTPRVEQSSASPRPRASPPAPRASVAATPTTEPKRQQSATGRVNLFGTIEFRSELRDTPQWERVVAEERKKSGLDNPVGLAAAWPATRESLKGKPLLEQLNGVNRFFNRWTYRSDVEIYKIRNYWATPAEFMNNSGDCKDYAIIKYYALKQVGVDTNSMRIVVLTDIIRNVAHAVLAVYHEGNAYILDNLSNLVLPYTQLTHYRPQFSVNENYRWVHMVVQR